MRPFYYSNHKGKRIFFFVLMIPVFFVVIGYVVMFLWNAILPAVIHVGTITFWQAMGILLLSKILFSGFRHGYPGRHMHSNSKMHYLKEKWENMTDEEREKYKENWKNWCTQGKE